MWKEWGKLGWVVGAEDRKENKNQPPGKQRKYKHSKSWTRGAARVIITARMQAWRWRHC